MRIAFLGICAQGHLNPMTALARELQSRDHEVVFISLPDAEPFVQAAQLTFVPSCEKEFPVGSVNEAIRQLSKLQPEEALQFTNQASLAITEAKLNSLPATLAAARVDAIVLDTWQYYVELVPMKLGMPYVHVSNALHFDLTGHTPLCFYDWPNETTPAAQASAAIRNYAERAGLKVDWGNPYATISKLAWFTQTPKEFDFPSSHLPPQFHHTGPFHDGTGRIDADFPWEQLTDGPTKLEPRSEGNPQRFNQVPMEFLTR